MARNWNPLIPLARLCMKEVAAEGDGVVSAPAVRERMWLHREEVLKAVDLFVSTTKLVNAAVSHVIKVYGPAYKVEGGYERINEELLDVEDYDRVIAFREEQLGAFIASLTELRNERDARALRDVTGVPELEPVSSESVE